MSKLIVDGIHKNFGSVTALQKISLEVAEGEFICLLGPSGSGKTTLLRIIAGLEQATSGKIILDGKTITRGGWHLQAEQRQIGLVFQNYAVWPHMTVEENVAFPLASLPLNRGEKEEKVRRAIRAVGLAGLEKRSPAQLSGGQLQRVALARALVTNPRVMLFDEPLSNLDARLRDEMRSQLRSWHQELKLTTVYVTHDQAEAMAMADRVAVMAEGRLQQIGGPTEIYREPCNHFVARFLGKANFSAGMVLRSVGSGENHSYLIKSLMGEIIARSREPLTPGTQVEVVIRPEDVEILPPLARQKGGNWRVTEVEFGGPMTTYRVNFEEGGSSWYVMALGQPWYPVGSEVTLKVRDAWVLPTAVEQGQIMEDRRSSGISTRPQPVAVGSA